MKGSRLLVVVGCHFFKGLYALAQTPAPTSSSSEATPATTEAPRVAGSKRSEAICGLPVDLSSDPVTCSDGSCAFVSILGNDRTFVGCCSNDGCDIRTTCLGGNTADGAQQLGCTGRLSRCATYSWIDQEAVSYSCATRSTVYHVYSDDIAQTSSTTTPYTSGDETRSLIATNTADSGDGDNNGGGGSSGGPLGSEYDLATRQRIGAGIGSGLFGCMLLGFFAVFGCFKRPRREYEAVRREEKHNPQILEDIRRGAPTYGGHSYESQTYESQTHGGHPYGGHPYENHIYQGHTYGGHTHGGPSHLQPMERSTTGQYYAG